MIANVFILDMQQPEMMCTCIILTIARLRADGHNGVA